MNVLWLSLFDVEAYIAVAAGEISIAPESRGRRKKICIYYLFSSVKHFSTGSLILMYKITKSGERKPPQCQSKVETNMQGIHTH